MTDADALELDRDVTAAAAAHQGLLAMLDDLLGSGRLDPAAATRLPDWTVGHVLTHLARNADSITRVLEATSRGEVVDRYVGGGEGRNADIEAGAGRTAEELVGDVRSSVWRLEQAWSRHHAWDGLSREAPGREIPVRDLVFARRREVEVHRADLGLGYEPEDWPDDYVRRELRIMEMRWNARQPMGLGGLPPAALALAPVDRLAWLLGRAEHESLPPAEVF